MRAGGLALIGAAAFAAHAARAAARDRARADGARHPGRRRQHRRAGASTTPKPLLSHLADVPRSPASVMKVVTTWSALEYLGPAYTWPTEVYFLGDFDGRKLDGDLAIKGYGDPYLVVEEVWKLLRALRRMGLTEITGDLVLDDSHFADRRARPRRVRRPAVSHLQRRAERAADELQGRAVPVHGRIPRTAASASRRTPCSRTSRSTTTWRSSTGRAAAIKPASRSTMPSPSRSSASCSTASSRAAATSTAWAARCCSTTRSRSACSRRCGRKSAGRSPASCARRTMPPEATPALVWQSKPLGEVVRSINKNSNNVMTRQLLYTLGAEAAGAPGTRENGVAAVRELLAARGLDIELADAAKRRGPVARRAGVDAVSRRSACARRIAARTRRSSSRRCRSAGSTARRAGGSTRRRLRASCI